MAEEPSACIVFKFNRCIMLIMIITDNKAQFTEPLQKPSLDANLIQISGVMLLNGINTHRNALTYLAYSCNKRR